MTNREDLLTIISAHIGGEKLPVMTPQTAIHLVYCRNKDNSQESFNNAIDSALEDGDIVVMMGADNEVKCSLTVSGSEKIVHSYPYTKEDAQDIKDIVSEEAKKETTNESLIEWGNKHIKKIDEL
jgi:protein-tyrosine-phosphatase